MDLYLRKVIHPQAHDYRVILKLDEGEFVIGSIGVQRGGAWRWGIDKIEELASGVRNAASRFRSLGRAPPPGDEERKERIKARGLDGLRTGNEARLNDLEYRLRIHVHLDRRRDDERPQAGARLVRQSFDGALKQ